MHQIQIGKTLDVEIVERQLAELWQQTAGERDPGDEAAVLRARVANLLVVVPSENALGEVRQMLTELTAIHPSRVLLLLADRGGADRDIEMSVTTHCQTDKRGAKRLCCEEITLKAQGSFVSELPSAALPLLVPDLSTFLWWRGPIQTSDKIFASLIDAADRLVIDSSEFTEPEDNLTQTSKLFDLESSDNVGISDLNWARLTFWRALLADFYDVPAYHPWLDRIDHVSIDYVAPEAGPKTVAPQALLIAGWLASRLGWRVTDAQPAPENDKTLSFKFTTKVRGSSPTVTEGPSTREIKLQLNRVERAARKPGRLVRVELAAITEKSSSFMVARSPDNLRLLSEARLGANTQRGRVLPVRNRSAARLLSREMEILCNDSVYEQALPIATTLMDHSRSFHIDHS